VIILEKVYKRVFGEKFVMESKCPHAEAEGQIIAALCGTPWKRPLILNVASRLGLDKPSPNYENCVRRMLTWKNCIGVLGGYDYQAYYIIGYDDKGRYFY
jgi:hypothetical protein